ncbi:MAG TPA: hypothetical protein VK203_31525 [Nostocaceae cyanobacterium]|nr:hypothetical protein [Nostocaceae cyanobacterium]
MDLHREYLDENLKIYYKLLKDLEEKELYEDDPRRKAKYSNDIKEIKQKIHDCNLQIQSLQTNEFIESKTSNNQDNYIIQDSALDLDKQPLKKFENYEKKYLQLTDLASFCAHTFPLLRWMHQPVPSQYVSWYFRKIQGFFICEGQHIPQEKKRYLYQCVELFFRCAYRLPSQDFDKDLDQIDDYARAKLWASYQGFMKISKNFGYKVITSDLEADSEIFLSNTLLEVLITLREGLSYTLDSELQNVEPLSPAERDTISFMIYVIDFIFDEKKARNSKQNLDLPEGIVLKLFDILNFTFKDYLGVKLPKREDIDALIDFPSYISDLSNCWEDDL